MVGTICTILSLVASWMIFKKMGRQGWEGIVPIYNVYVLCSEFYGNGWKCLLLLIPLYNIYFGIKIYIDWAKNFGKGTGFAIGMLFLPFIFQMILAFSDAQYKDGSVENTSQDFVSQVVEKTKTIATNAVNNEPKTDVVAEMEKYKKMLDSGIITQEEFDLKKKEILGL